MIIGALNKDIKSKKLLKNRTWTCGGSHKNRVYLKYFVHDCIYWTFPVAHYFTRNLQFISKTLSTIVAKYLYSKIKAGFGNRLYRLTSFRHTHGSLDESQKGNQCVFGKRLAYFRILEDLRPRDFVNFLLKTPFPACILRSELTFISHYNAYLSILSRSSCNFFQSYHCQRQHLYSNRHDDSGWVGLSDDIKPVAVFTVILSFSIVRLFESTKIYFFFFTYII